MFTLITKFFRKSGRLRGDRGSQDGAQFGSDSAPHLLTVETAQLSLAAILERFPDELKPTIEKMPGLEITVALPVPTILKQLPLGAVKMSLASMHRQAPQGVFRRGLGEEKRMIAVPLAEVLKRVRPELLQRRHDQRPYRLPDNGFNLFGDKSNPYALSPTEPVKESIALRGSLAMENGEDAAGGASTNGHQSEVLSERGSAEGGLCPPSEFGKPVQGESVKPPSELAAAANVQPPVLLPIAEVAASWPEPIKGEVAAMDGAILAVPANEIASGLAKGRVAFPWGKLRVWITPLPLSATEADEAIELQLPLRILAPIFLKQSRRTGQRKQAISATEEIPALFRGSNVEPGGDLAPTLQLVEPLVIPAREGSIEVTVDAPRANIVTPAPESQECIPESTQEVNGTPIPSPSPQSLAELFGQPDKSNWSPLDIVENVVKLRGVTGAVVALQEGLVVANRLPDRMNPEVFAAFLPQIFARLNQYTGEMRLGEVRELLLESSEAQCKIFGLGEVFFAALGEPGEALPSADLALCARELKK
jgi:predicted regulator of Ras-like GTPase activity (Roadblock/LC7/MglB family)